MSVLTSAVAKLPPVDYELSTHSTKFVPGIRSADGVSALISKIYPSAFEKCAPGFGKTEIHLEMYFEHTRDDRGVIPMGLLMFLTLGVIPSYERDRFRYHVLAFRSSELVREYDYYDYVSSWYGIVFLPFSSEKALVAIQVIENMLVAFLADFEEDRALYASGTD